MKPIISILFFFLLSNSTYTFAEEAEKKELSSDDTQALIQIYLSQECKKSIHPLMLKMAGITTGGIPLNDAIEAKACGCTAKFSAQGKGMQWLYQFPQDKLMDAMKDKQFVEYFKAKIFFMTMQCASMTLDYLLETDKSTNKEAEKPANQAN